YAERWSIAGRWEGIDNQQVAHDVEIVKNSATALLAPTSIGSYGQQVPFDLTIDLAKGDTIDFVVHPGPTRTNLSNGPAARIPVDRVATHFRVSAPASAAAGTPVSVTVTARDTYNRAVPGYTGTVHFTSSDPLAVLPGDYTFTAADKG